MNVTGEQGFIRSEYLNSFPFKKLHETLFGKEYNFFPKIFLDNQETFL